MIIIWTGCYKLKKVKFVCVCVCVINYKFLLYLFSKFLQRKIKYFFSISNKLNEIRKKKFNLNYLFIL